MNKKQELLEKLKIYENKWVAILDDREVVASGDDAFEAKQKAEAKGIRNFILFKVLPFHAGYAPTLL